MTVNPVPTWAYPGLPVGIVAPNNAGDVAYRGRVEKIAGQVVHVRYVNHDGREVTMKFTRSSDGCWLQSPRAQGVWSFSAEMVQNDDARLDSIERQMDGRRRHSEAVLAAGAFARRPSPETARKAKQLLEEYLEGLA